MALTVSHRRLVSIVVTLVTLLPAGLALAKTTDPKASPDLAGMAFSVVGGLGIFLIGMQNLSQGAQTVAGERLRRMIAAVTSNRLLGVGTGTLVTCLVQSSSITTVLTVGFVNSGLMLFEQAIGVIMGANVGTTITGWILVLDVGKYGLPLIGVFAFVYLFSKNERWRYTALALLGLGMVFFGLELMKDGFKPVREIPVFTEAFRWFDARTLAGTIKCVLTGALLTAVVQSSSATLGITIAIATTGLMPFETAAALVLGENIGTTITAWLASLGTTTNAKRAAYFHILFNVTGAILVVAIFRVYIWGVSLSVEAVTGVNPRAMQYGVTPGFAAIMTSAVAASHTGFNVLLTVINIPLVRSWARALRRLVPEREKEIPHLTPLDLRFVESPVLGMEQSRGEILKMAESVDKMLAWTIELVEQESPDQKLADRIFHREEILDRIEAEVIHYVIHLLSGNVAHSVAEEGRAQLRMADEYESIADYVAQIAKARLRLRDSSLQLTTEERGEYLSLLRQTASYLDLIHKAIAEWRPDVLAHTAAPGEAITRAFKRLRDQHLRRISGGGPDAVDPRYTLAYNALLASARKIKDHALNIAEALAGHKAATH